MQPVAQAKGRGRADDLTEEQRALCQQWGWSTEKTGKVSPDEKQAIIAYCRQFGCLPPMHKNVRRSYQQTADKQGWFLPFQGGQQMAVNA